MNVCCTFGGCSISRFLASVDVLVLFLLMEWFCVPHKSPWASLACLSVSFVERNTSITASQRSRASNPSMRNPASKEIISDAVELWDSDVCFLHIQLMGTNVWLPKTHNVRPEVDFESSRSPTKSESWNSPNLHCLAVFPHDNIVCIHLRDEYMKSIDSGVCHRLWSILLWIVRAYLPTIEYQVVQFLPSINISEQFESMYLTILQQILFLLLWSGVQRCME